MAASHAKRGLRDARAMEMGGSTPSARRAD
jgi:hypothetical protein